MVGTQGPVLDLGCGCGFATALLAAGGRRTVVGADHDAGALRNAADSVGGARFVRASANALPLHGMATILVADVLYLLSPEEQARALTDCRRALLPGGVLVLKTTDNRPRWKHWWNVAQEWVVVRVLRLTKGSGSLTFRGGGDYEELLRSSGFEIEERIDLGAGYLHPHIVIRARRPR
jgi:SAM-dependent methyltransferase